VTLSIVTLLCNHYAIWFQNFFINLKGNPIFVKQSLPIFPPCCPWQPLICCLFLWICLFWIYHIRGIIPYMTFYIWLISLIYSVFRVHHCYGMYQYSIFMVINNIPLSGYTIFCLFIHQLMDILVFTFWLLWTVQLWTFLYKFLLSHLFSILLGMDLRVELLAHVVILCLTSSGIVKLFHSGCAILCGHRQCMWVADSLHPGQHLFHQN
jgi:hypothetical protein